MNGILLPFLLLWILTIWSMFSYAGDLSIEDLKFFQNKLVEKLDENGRYNPNLPDRYEYVELKQWNYGGGEWVPDTVDFVVKLKNNGTEVEKDIKIIFSFSIKLGYARGDPKYGLTDAILGRKSAIWVPSLWTQEKIIESLEPNQVKEVLIKDIDIYKIRRLRRGYWPWKIKIEVGILPSEDDDLSNNVAVREVDMIPGD